MMRICRCHFIPFIIAIILACCGCGSSSVDSDAEIVNRIMRAGGNNHAELHKIISQYQQQNDPLKYRAVLFLLENLSDQYHYTGQGVNTYRALFDTMNNRFLHSTAIFNRTWDSIQLHHLSEDQRDLQRVNDLEIIKAGYIDKQVEASFRAWHLPWARQLTFDEFCEYILPVKFMNEDLEDWKSMVQRRYAAVIDSLGGNNDPKKVCLLLNDDLKRTFYVNARFRCYWGVTYSDLQKMHCGTCSNATQLTAMVMSGLGLPVVMDYSPYWGNKNSGHEWNALLYKGKTLHFVGSESDPGMDKIEFTRSYLLRRKRPKIFRRTFAIQKNSLAFLADSTVAIPPVFANTHMKDVTPDYLPVTDVSVWLNHEQPNQKFAYLCVFNNNKWEPVFWAGIDWLGRAKFKAMGRDILYMPMYYTGGLLTPAGDPFILDKNGGKLTVEPLPEHTERIVIKKKYPEDNSNFIVKGDNYELFYWNNKWISLGKTAAAADSLVYTNAPRQSLLWARDLDRGEQERIFTYNNGQVWW